MTKQEATTKRLTIETFGPDNRSKLIGNSMYRIATDDTMEITSSTVWHILEVYNNPETEEWSYVRDYFTTDLQNVIDIFNSITEEKEIIHRRWKKNDQSRSDSQSP